MANTTILEATKSSVGSPYAWYTVIASEVANSRTTTTTQVKVWVKAKLNSADSFIGSGYTITGTLTINGTATSITLKKSSTTWEGTSWVYADGTPSGTPKTITVKNLSPTATSIPKGSMTFKVTNSSGSSCSLNTTTATAALPITKGHTLPVIDSFSMTETNSALTAVGVANNLIIENLSQKSLSFTYTLYDDATMSEVGVTNGTQNLSGTTNPFTLNCAGVTFTKTDGYIDLKPYIKDSLSTTSTNGEATAFSYVPYIPVSVTSSTTTAKRIGQVSGRVGLTINGAVYKGNDNIGSVSQSGTYKPTIKYKFWKNGTSEPSSFSYTIPAADISTSGNTYIVTNYDIGSTTEGATNYFDPAYGYKVKIYVQDTFTNTTSLELTVPAGEPVWTEYSNRVDFKKLTIGNEPIIITDTFEQYTGAIAVSNNSTMTFSNIAKTGYTPIMISGVYCSGTRSSFIRIYAFFIDTSGAGKVIFKNTHTSTALAANDTKIKIYVSYIKN